MKKEKFFELAVDDAVRALDSIYTEVKNVKKYSSSVEDLIRLSVRASRGKLTHVKPGFFEFNLKSKIKILKNFQDDLDKLFNKVSRLNLNDEEIKAIDLIKDTDLIHSLEKYRKKLI